MNWKDILKGDRRDDYLKALEIFLNAGAISNGSIREAFSQMPENEIIFCCNTFFGIVYPKAIVEDRKVLTEETQYERLNKDEESNDIDDFISRHKKE
jgi:hypothetical protein|tara:strand:- start:191 stop:481 length:291 start_codon:yes stop_codon:yes gene_type:complete